MRGESKMKIIIWGLGEIYNRFKDKLVENDIVCMVDNNSEE